MRTVWRLVCKFLSVSKFPDGKREISFGERLIVQREVPPLGVEWPEAVTQHRTTQDHAIGELLCGDYPTNGTLAVIARIFARFRISTEVGMALRTEPVEGATHVEFLLRLHVEQRQVDR